MAAVAVFTFSIIDEGDLRTFHCLFTLKTFEATKPITFRNHASLTIRIVGSFVHGIQYVRIGHHVKIVTFISIHSILQEYHCQHYENC